MAPKGEVGIAYIYSFAAKAIMQRNGRPKEKKAIAEEKIVGGGFLEIGELDSCIAKHRRDPQNFKADDAYYHDLSNVLPGGETTDISLTAVIHFLN